MSFGEAEEVVIDEYLTVAGGTRSDPDRRDAQAARDLRGDRRRNRFEHDGEAARGLELERVVDQLPRRLAGLSLRLEAAEHRRGLRREADVTHHGNARAHNRARARDRRTAAFQLHD